MTRESQIPDLRHNHSASAVTRFMITYPEEKGSSRSLQPSTHTKVLIERPTMPTSITSKLIAEEGHKGGTPLHSHRCDQGCFCRKWQARYHKLTSNSPKRIQQKRCPCEPSNLPEEKTTCTQFLLSLSESGTDTSLEYPHPLTTRPPKRTTTKGQDMPLHQETLRKPGTKSRSKLLDPKLPQHPKAFRKTWWTQPNDPHTGPPTSASRRIHLKKTKDLYPQL
jgi:hypothetical protein